MRGAAESPLGFARCRFADWPDMTTDVSPDVGEPRRLMEAKDKTKRAIDRVVDASIAPSSLRARFSETDYRITSNAFDETENLCVIIME